MYAETFEFDGVKSSDLGIYLLNYDGFSNNGVSVAGSEITFNTTKAPSSKKWHYHSPKYETQLTWSMQIGKLSGEELTQQDCAYWMRWLVRSDGCHYLRFLQNEYENTYFNCTMTAQWFRLPDGRIVGMELQVTCDAPFGYSEEKQYSTTCNNGDSFQIYDDGDDVGAIVFDKVEITSNSATSKLSITNDLETIYSPMTVNVSEFKNLQNSEKITIQNNQITSSVLSRDIGDDFNYKYLRLINWFNQGTDTRINTYTVMGGSCKIDIVYRTIRKVLP